MQRIEWRRSLTRDFTMTARALSKLSLVVLNGVVEPNEEFLLMTMPATKKGTEKVIAQRGVMVNGIY